MTDVLLNDGRPLPQECEQCLEKICRRVRKPIVNVYCSTPRIGEIAMLAAITTGIGERTDIKVVEATEVVICPRGRRTI